MSKERQNWIVAKMAARGSGPLVDVVDSDFVIDYIVATGADYASHSLGAPECPQLDQDLAALYRLGFVGRNLVGAYALTALGKLLADLLKAEAA